MQGTRTMATTTWVVLLTACTVLPGTAQAASPRRAAQAHPLAKQIRAHVARMPRLDPEVHGPLAQTIVLEASEAGVDPLLVVALIHTESQFDPEAVSAAGAVGLMQLREPTMRSVAARSRLASDDPRDPIASVQAGVRYLRRLLDAFGEIDLALMAYNAGPNRIVAHLRRGEIPARFHAYPRKVKAELDRLRQALTASTEPGRGRA
jgi:soluble lytic murein transglycosylase-like protein